MHLPEMNKRKVICVLALAFCLVAALFDGKSVKDLHAVQSQPAGSGYCFQQGTLPVADAQQSYLVVVPTASVAEWPSKVNFAEASFSLEEGARVAFRHFQVRVPIPEDSGQRLVLLNVLRL